MVLICQACCDEVCHRTPRLGGGAEGVTVAAIRRPPSRAHSGSARARNMPAHRTRADATRYLPTLLAWETRGNAYSILLSGQRQGGRMPVNVVYPTAKAAEKRKRMDGFKTLNPVGWSIATRHPLTTQPLRDCSLVERRVCERQRAEPVVSSTFAMKWLAVLLAGAGTPSARRDDKRRPR